MRILKFLSFFFALFLAEECQFKVFSQETTPFTDRIMFYNVENLFDTKDDSLKEDNDFLPEGVMRWNYTRYEKKINSLFKTIVAAGEWDPPDVAGFCEVENRKVLEDLCYHTNLSKFNYSIIHEESPDRRGIDVCLIFRKNLVSVLNYAYWKPASTTGQIFNSRSVLYVKMSLHSDTFHLILNHWPSRRGGVLAGEDSRASVASMVRNKIDSIFSTESPDAKILIMGDFNCNTDDQIIKSFLLPDRGSNPLINLSEKASQVGQGSYRYQGKWEMIDQVIVSDGLISGKNGLYTGTEAVKVFRPDFLLKKDPKFPGMSPFSTYHGFKYQGGFSDHLPVTVDLRVR
jgi:endonuclease/exonuclease/phosphatase family metal-dependent hydrolase